MWSHLGDSIYHSLQSMFSTRFTRNSTFQTTYTWSKNIGTTTFGYVGSDTIFADNANSRVNRGPVDFDRRHVLSMNLVYNAPLLDGSNAFIRHTLGGWELGSIYSYASGPALTIQGNSGLGDVTGTGRSGRFGARPLRDYSQPCHLSGSPSGQWLNPAAFTYNGYQLGTFGNSGPGQCAGPPINDFDLSFNKNWRVGFLKNRFFGESARIQFRLETFNLLNHPQFRFNGQNTNFGVSGAVPVDASGADCTSAPTTCVA
jgi:hypothetical protein